MNLQNLNNKYSVYMRMLLEEEQKKVEKLKKRFSILLFFVFTLLTLSVVFCLSTVKLQEQNFMLQNENKELLVLIHENVKMGLTSTKKLLSLLLNTNNKIKGTLESELKTYESLYNRTKKEIKKQKSWSDFYRQYEFTV